MTEDILKHLHKPGHCFCHFSQVELQKWAIKRFEGHISTTDLLASTNDPREKELISVVALVDLDQETMLKMMGDVDLPEHHILHCYFNTRKLLKRG